jgi:hypothetical protein
MTNAGPAAELAKARRIADGLRFACRIPDKIPDFFACGGPAAEAYWSYFTPARIVSLLAAIEALTSALTRHRQWFTDSKNVKRCGGCLEPSPCPDDPDMIVARALSGKDSTDGN